MIKSTMPAALLMLAACGGGEDRAATPPDDRAEAARLDAAPVESWDKDAMARWNEDRGYEPDPAEAAPSSPNKDIGTGDKAIPAAIRGRWGLVAADCTSTKGDAKGLLTIDAATLRFYESHGQLARLRERDATRIVGDFKFEGEGQQWDRLMVLDAHDGGQTLIRRDYGEGAATDPMRYTRCS